MGIILYVYNLWHKIYTCRDHNLVEFVTRLPDETPLIANTRDKNNALRQSPVALINTSTRIYIQYALLMRIKYTINRKVFASKPSVIEAAGKDRPECGARTYRFNAISIHLEFSLAWLRSETTLWMSFFVYWL